MLKGKENNRNNKKKLSANGLISSLKRCDLQTRLRRWCFDSKQSTSLAKTQNKDQKMVLIYQIAAGNKLADLAIQISDTVSFKIRKYKGGNYNQ